MTEISFSNSQEATRESNVLDPIHEGLDPTVWDKPNEREPNLKKKHREWIVKTIHGALGKHGYDGMDKWGSLYLTGSLTTYQYTDKSDCDVSLFVNAEVLPEWSRAEMIGIMISEFDMVYLPGTTHNVQCFVVSPKLRPENLYRPGLRSGYNIMEQKWLVPPEHREHDVEREEYDLYTHALEVADKMERLIRYEPDKAKMYYEQLHKRRQRDEADGKGDYSESNIAYKMLENRGLFDQLRELGEYVP